MPTSPPTVNSFSKGIQRTSSGHLPADTTRFDDAILNQTTKHPKPERKGFTDGQEGHYREIFDDTDGSPAEQTVPFGLDGVAYEIDLSNPNAEELREALAPYVSAARRTGGRRIKVAVGQATGNTTAEIETAAEYTATHDIRIWARQNGHEVSDRGRIPASVVDAYHASQKAESSGPSRKNRTQSKTRPRSTRSK